MGRPIIKRPWAEPWSISFFAQITTSSVLLALEDCSSFIACTNGPAGRGPPNFQILSLVKWNDIRRRVPTAGWGRGNLLLSRPGRPDRCQYGMIKASIFYFRGSSVCHCHLPGYHWLVPQGHLVCKCKRQWLCMGSWSSVPATQGTPLGHIKLAPLSFPSNV